MRELFAKYLEILDFATLYRGNAYLYDRLLNWSAGKVFFLGHLVIRRQRHAEIIQPALKRT